MTKVLKVVMLRKERQTHTLLLGHSDFTQEKKKVMQSIFTPFKVPKSSPSRKEFMSKEIKNCKRTSWDKPQLLNIQSKKLIFRIFNNLIQGPCYLKRHK